MPARVIKIAVVGPLASGKSSFINLATETRETLTESYIPTIPVRIIEYEASAPARGRAETVNVHIYDCSGDTKYEHTWPGMTYKLNGTVFVYNPEEKKQAEELNLWYNNFVEKPNLSEKCCLLVASKKNHDEGGRTGPDAKLSTLFSDISRLVFNGKADEVETIKQTFGDFVKRVLSETSRGQEHDERFT